MLMNSLTLACAHQLAQMIRDSEVSDVEVLDAYLVQISTSTFHDQAVCAIYFERFGSTTLGKLSKLRRTQSMPTSLLSLIF